MRSTMLDCHVCNKLWLRGFVVHQHRCIWATSWAWCWSLWFCQESNAVWGQRVAHLQAILLPRHMWGILCQVQIARQNVWILAHSDVCMPSRVQKWCIVQASPIRQSPCLDSFSEVCLCKLMLWKIVRRIVGFLQTCAWRDLESQAECGLWWQQYILYANHPLVEWTNKYVECHRRVF